MSRNFGLEKAGFEALFHFSIILSRTNSEVLMGRKKGMECVEENFKIAKQGGGGGEKSKKKNRAVIDDDAYSIGIELSEEPTVQDETVV
ncbi:hypothetical protein K7X08_022213 [Anisodus acutangulus]|uniref:Uncharacterized protein n=1 Tax=Anisodus acutangulus TaxID=402998 RepID=A0A9Q1L6P2_9SOLA|nr:hypothetical protein K7X08_022213 [Anisodus acutangulus]